MNVWQYYARYYNFGDYGLGVGVRNIFKKYFDNNLIFKLFDVHDFKFDGKIVRKMNESADLVLVGGGGLIHGSHSKWMFNMPYGLISKIEAPIIFYGLGYNNFRGQMDLSNKIVKNIKMLQNKAISFTVRNDGTKERLEKLGLSLAEVPDPGFFVDCEYPRIDNKQYVVIQLANDMRKHRGFDENHLISSIKEVINFLIKKNYKVILAPHVRADILLCERLLDLADKDETIKMWDFFDILRDEHTLKGLSYYKHASFVIGMRGHSQIFSIGLGVPVITVSNHDKNRGLLKNLKVQELIVEVNEPKLVKRLIEMISLIEDDYAKIKEEYHTKICEMTEFTEKFLRNIRPDFDKARNIHILSRERKKKSIITKLAKKLNKFCNKCFLAMNASFR